MTNPIYPNITVKCVRTDESSFAMIGRVLIAMREAGCSDKEINKFREEASRNKFSNVMAASRKYVRVI